MFPWNVNSVLGGFQRSFLKFENSPLMMGDASVWEPDSVTQWFHCATFPVATQICSILNIASNPPTRVFQRPKSCSLLLYYIWAPAFLCLDLLCAARCCFKNRLRLYWCHLGHYWNVPAEIAGIDQISPPASVPSGRKELDNKVGAILPVT